jgi:hypothetical protein
MNAFLLVGNARKAIDNLAAILTLIFAPASAKASVSGENRGLAASAFASALPKLGKFDAIEIHTDDGVITVKNENLVTVLQKVTESYNRMEEVRAELEDNESAYKLIRSFVPSNPSDGKRGAKKKDPASKYAAMLGDLS